MSIETLLTLAVAAVLLVGAVLLRFLAIGAFRLGAYLWAELGPGSPRRRGELEDALPARSLRDRTAGFLEGAGAITIYIVATIARALRPIGEGLRVAARALWYALVAAHAWAVPRAEAAYAWIAPRADAVFEKLSIVREAPVPVLAHPSSATDPRAPKSNLERHAGAA
jgi:hypothetical protein